MTTLTTSRRDTAHAPCARPPVVFTGLDGPSGGDVLDTWTTSRSDEAWARAVADRLGTDERAYVSLSFAPGGPAVAHRVAARPVRVSGTAVPLADVPGAAALRHDVVAVPDEATFAEHVRVALDRIERGALEKVVLGRCLDVVSEPPLDPAVVVARLLADPPGPHVFCLPLGDDVRGPLLLGASPELLVRRTGPEVRSTPLAGSAPRADDPRVDAERAEALQDSAKDLAEHAFVVDAIRDVLGPLCVELHADDRPHLVRTDTMWHLATPVVGRLAPGAPSALALARMLHPTPAVGGVPTRAALDTVDELEGDLRGHLAGSVGWVDGAGDGEFAVTIRAGVLHGARLRLFAGAGVVAGSDPGAEVRETRAKLSTMARAVGL
ncbi:isochorismate synthase MenF [Cellulomonas sp. HZM]|uniref:isochorismate synthase n=1 Tax=Cellulomonas sp. HZM TaxID=1454010 RepID=UPI00068B1F01|nr:isochorismate synthase [Cellulomonas sp. HZM]